MHPALHHVVQKWGRSYDVILRKSGNRMYLQVRTRLRAHVRLLATCCVHAPTCVKAVHVDTCRTCMHQCRHVPVCTCVETEYMQQLDAVAEYITEWGVVDTVKRGIASAHKRGPGMTGGRAAKCIAIPLDVDLSESRRSEFA
eukprot:354192-Chlamydomonas_euryale.AAC.4